MCGTGKKTKEILQHKLVDPRGWKYWNSGYHLNIVLHVQVVDDIRLAQLRILDGLLQRKAFRVERDQTVADGPAFDRVLIKGILCWYICFYGIIYSYYKRRLST